MRLQYRPDIDGLRAVAVCAVIAYHADFALTSGGFVGVDIFFVISGYLITSIILTELEPQSSFRIITFYERRARRIFPALFLVLFLTSLAALWVLTPTELTQFATTLFGAVFFVSNIVFWRETGYFADAADLQPLLHTWSLAVEEQFYIIFPLFLLSLHRISSSRKLLALTTTALISFTICIIGVHLSEAAAFYLAPTRAWELLLGAIIATASLSSHDRSSMNLGPAIRDCLALAGFIAVTWAIFWLQPTQTFPSYSALVPTLGTAAIIIAGQSPHPAIVTTILSARPLVVVGQMSYSLYLWHWPIFVFYNYLLDRERMLVETWLLIALSFVLAAFSWYFVERPFRDRRLLKRRSSLFRASGVGAIVLSMVGTAFFVTNGLPQRLPPHMRSLATTDHSAVFARRFDCVSETLVDDQPYGLCLIGSSALEEVRVVIWGDSHALALAPAFETLAKGIEGGMAVASIPGCPHLFGLERVNHYHSCRRLADALYDVIAVNHIEKVILINSWTGTLYHQDNEFAGRRGQTRETRLANVEDALKHSLDILNDLDIDVALLTPIPAARRPVPRAIVREAILGLEFELGTTIKAYHDHFAGLGAMIEANKDTLDLVVSTTEIFCSEGYCPARSGAIPYYFDASHLNEAGTQRLEAGLEFQLQSFLADLRQTAIE